MSELSAGEVLFGRGFIDMITSLGTGSWICQ